MQKLFDKETKTLREIIVQLRQALGEKSKAKIMLQYDLAHKVNTDLVDSSVWVEYDDLVDKCNDFLYSL